jgi:hypothetical protein
MVLEERQPTLHLRLVGLTLQLLEIARHGRFGKPQIRAAAVRRGCAALPRMDCRTSCAELTAESPRRRSAGRGVWSVTAIARTA